MFINHVTECFKDDAGHKNIKKTSSLPVRWEVLAAGGPEQQKNLYLFCQARPMDAQIRFENVEF